MSVLPGISAALSLDTLGWATGWSKAQQQAVDSNRTIERHACP